MILAALALFSQLALQTPAVRPAIATMATQDRSYYSPKPIPKSLTTGVTLTIDTNGRVQNCVVTSPSRWPALDPALCRTLNRMKFEASAHSNDRPTVRTLEIEWEPPRYFW